MARGKLSGPKSATSRDVARAANVSQALVSRAFSGNGRIAADTRQRILEAAAEIGWQPNALAASMVTGDAPLVAVITTRLTFEWRAQVLSHLLKSFQEGDLKPLIFYAENDDEVDRLLADTITWRTRGVIVTAGVVNPQRADAILSRGQFFAALNRPGNHGHAFSVATDNRLGGAMAARLLRSEGRRRFAVIAGPQDSWASARRCEGFLAALDEAGADATVWNNADMSIEAGKASARRFLDHSGNLRPDGVFSTNDAMALGFLDGLRDQAVTVGEDVSLIGYDNIAASSWTPYQLTTFEQPLDEMVARVLAHIGAHQEGKTLDFADSLSGTPCRLDADGVIYCAPKIVHRTTTRSHS